MDDRAKTTFGVLNTINKESPINQNKLSQSAGFTYSHIMEVLESYESRGWITKEQSGRQKILKVTKKGKKVILLLEELFREGFDG